MTLILLKERRKKLMKQLARLRINNEFQNKLYLPTFQKKKKTIVPTSFEAGK